MKIIFYIALIGKTLLILFTKVGILSRFIFKILSYALTGPFYAKAFFNQLIQIGFMSLPVVGLTAVFT